MGVRQSIQAQIHNAVFPKDRPRVEYENIANFDLTLDRQVRYMYFKKSPSNAQKTTSDEDRVVVVISHGNMETMNEAIKSILEWFPGILDFVAWEYPGYGMRGDEEPSRETIEADARDIAFTFKNRKVIFVGRSLGGYPAIVSALRHQELGGTQKLLLLSTFASIMHARPVLSLLARTELNDFENFKIAREYRGQAIIVHGDADPIVHVSNARVLQKNFPSSEIVIMKGFGHNGLLPYLSNYLPMKKIVNF